MLARAIGESINADDRPHPVHARHAARRHHRLVDLRPEARASFEFQPGPVFTNVLLADEINRATPKTQSALLEAMAERRVSADGTTYDLPRPFLVLATQNPVEQAGTFPLPEAQLDRFLFKLSMGYMDRDAEFEVMFDNSVQLSIEDLGAGHRPDDVQAMIDYAATIEVSPEVGYYIVDLVQATRQRPGHRRRRLAPRHDRPAQGGPRAGRLRRPRATSTPTTSGPCSRPVLGHRIILNPDAILRGETVDAVLERVTGRGQAPARRPRSRRPARPVRARA